MQGEGHSENPEQRPAILSHHRSSARNNGCPVGENAAHATRSSVFGGASSPDLYVASPNFNASHLPTLFKNIMQTQLNI